jgi:hypothetical protein
MPAIPWSTACVGQAYEWGTPPYAGHHEPNPAWRWWAPWRARRVFILDPPEPLDCSALVDHMLLEMRRARVMLPLSLF